MAACWVETVGGIELNAVREEDGRIVGQFRRLPNVGYSPKHCSVPLRLVFKMALGRVIEEAPKGPNGPFEAFLEGLAQLVGWQTDLAKKIKESKELESVAVHLADKLRDQPLVWLNEPTIK